MSVWLLPVHSNVYLSKVKFSHPKDGDAGLKQIIKLSAIVFTPTVLMVFTLLLYDVSDDNSSDDYVVRQTELAASD